MLIEMRCPNCGASLEFDNAKEYMYCTFCGTRIANVEETTNINVTHSGEVIYKRDTSDDPNLYIFYSSINPQICLSTLIRPSGLHWIYSHGQNMSYHLEPGRYVITFRVGRRAWNRVVFIPNDNTPVRVQVVFERGTKILVQQPPQGLQDFKNSRPGVVTSAETSPVQSTNSATNDSNPQPVAINTQSSTADNLQATKKRKKPIVKRWWFWLILSPAILVVGLISLIVLLLAISSVADQSKDSISSQVAVSSVEQFRPTRQEYIDSCTTIDYKTLARNPDRYKGERFKFTGEVIQVSESTSLFGNSTTTLRVNVTPEENQFADSGYLWSDTIICSVTIPDGEDRILEGDVIELYGECYGLYTYESVLGNSISIPRIDIEYYTIRVNWPQ